MPLRNILSQLLGQLGPGAFAVNQPGLLDGIQNAFGAGGQLGAQDPNQHPAFVPNNNPSQPINPFVPTQTQNPFVQGQTPNPFIKAQTQDPFGQSPSQNPFGGLDRGVLANLLANLPGQSQVDPLSLIR